MSNFITNGELRMEAERLCDENERLEAENAKLRALCEVIRICARDNQCSLCYLAGEKCDFSDHMRELGVGVDE